MTSEQELFPVFVYGTLRQTNITDRTIQGELWDLGAFPAAVNVGEGESLIHGEILWVTQPQLKRLDEYEGVGRGLYRRVSTVTNKGEDVFVYEWNRDTIPPRAMKLKTGKWIL